MQQTTQAEKIRVLIIDDEIDIQSVLKETLEYEGFQVDTAASSEQAKKYLDHTIYKLILVDIRLEGSLSGVDVVELCKSIPSKPKVAVISATPYKLLKSMFEERGLIFSIVDYLEKPNDLKPDVFMKVVRNILKDDLEKK